MISNQDDVLRHLKARDERHANRIAFKIGGASLEFAPGYVRVTDDLDVIVGDQLGVVLRYPFEEDALDDAIEGNLA